MDILVLLEDGDDECGARATRAADARALAYVHSAPDPASGGRFFSHQRAGWRGTAGRDVITLCGDQPDADTLALALAAAVEGRRATAEQQAVRHLEVWADRGAAGDAAWRDRASGRMLTQDVDIAAPTLAATAARLLADSGAVIRQTVAKLAMPDWPEGMRRAISFTVRAPDGDDGGADGDCLLASLREADGYDDGD